MRSIREVVLSVLNVNIVTFRKCCRDNWEKFFLMGGAKSVIGFIEFVGFIMLKALVKLVFCLNLNNVIAWFE